MLNGLAGQPLFPAGLSFSGGLTYELSKKQIGKDWYLDTPGLSDVKLREKAAAAINKALEEGGAYKIVFVITLEAGRVRPADRTTMELILKSAPISHYGVLINKLGKKERERIVENQDGAGDAVVAGLMDGLPAKTPYFYMKQRNDTLAEEENAVPPIDEDFARLLLNIPAVEIKRGEAKPIDANQFDEMTAKFEAIIREMHEDKKKLQQMMERDREHHDRMIQDMMARNDQLMKQNLDNQPGWASNLLPLINIGMTLGPFVKPLLTQTR